MTKNERIRQWISSGEHGMSSLTIAHVLSPYPVPFQWGPRVPLDPDDFRRCRLLIQAVPEWKKRLHLVAERFPMWIPFVREWDKIEETFLQPERDKKGRLRYSKCYDLMQRLGEESHLWDGWIPECVRADLVTCWKKYDGRTLTEAEVQGWLDWIAKEKAKHG